MSEHDQKEMPPAAERRDNRPQARNPRAEHHPDGLHNQPRGAGTYGYEPNPRRDGSQDAHASGDEVPAEQTDGETGQSDAARRTPSVSGTSGSAAVDVDPAPRPIARDEGKR